MNYEILINRQNRCPTLSQDLVEVTPLFPKKRRKKIYLEKKVYQAFQKIQKEGLKYGYYFDIVEGYRSVKDQRKIFTQMIDRYSLEDAICMTAVPNFSEHHSGLAIDIEYCRRTKKGAYRKRKIRETDPEYSFLLQHMHQYGFILRYPKEKQHYPISI